MIVNESLKDIYRLLPDYHPEIGDRVIYESSAGIFKTGSIINKGNDSYGSNQKIQVLFDDRSGGIQTEKVNCFNIDFKDVLDDIRKDLENINSDSRRTTIVEEER